MKIRTLAAMTAALTLCPALSQAATVPASDLFVPSVTGVDTTAYTATFPLHRAQANGKTVWYVMTDSSDAAVAKADGLDYAPDLAKLGDAAIAQATQQNGTVVLPSAPDFSPTRTYVAGAGGFPPSSATPGSVADATYSPFVHVDGIAGVFNAPVVASGDGPFDVTTHTNTEDRVVAIDTAKNTVTLVLARGFFGGKPVWYVSTEASDPVAAAVERATYAPRLAKADSAVAIPIGVVASGPLEGAEVQGLGYLALKTPLGENATAQNAATIGSPLNVLSAVPDRAHPYAANDYSPLWAAFVVTAPQTKRLTSYADVAVAGIKPAGFVVNCPAIAVAPDGY